MKRLSEVPVEVLKHIESEHERALQTVFAGYVNFADFPVRPVKMKIYRESEGTESLEMTIIPPVSVKIQVGAFVEQNQIERDGISYSVTGSLTPFPYGHIYQGSGHVCLGDIFVPELISDHCPTQPLETLFLHNDRNLHHGGASLMLSEKQREQLLLLLLPIQEHLSIDARKIGKNGLNLLKEDTIWILGADLYRAFPIETALRWMKAVYQIMFGKEGGS